MSSCSSFAARAALVSRARSMALNMKRHQLSKLLLLVDCRTKLKPPVPKDFGNAWVGACCFCTTGELVAEPISSTAGRIKKAIERWMRTTCDRAYSFDMYEYSFFSLSSLVFTSSQGFDHGSADFGWGKPRCFGTSDQPRTACVFTTEGSLRKGIVMLLGLPLSAMNAFEKLVQFSTCEPETPSMRSKARL